MVSGIGIDIVDVERVRQSLDRWGDRWAGKIFTDYEIERCGRGAGDHAQKYASRFAAKEAFFKAALKPNDAKFFPKKIEIRTLESGAPEIVLAPGAFPELEESGDYSVHVSISHEKNVAAGMVVIESASK